MGQNAFYKHVALTARSYDFVRDVIAGKQMRFTKVGLGDGSLGGQDIEQMTELVHYVMDAEILSVVASGDQATLSIKLNSDEIKDAFMLREIGIYAEIDGEEILFAYLNSGDKFEYLTPSSDGQVQSHKLEFAIGVGDANNVEIVFSDSSISEGSITEAMLGDSAKGYITGEVNKHSKSKITDADGVHGLRVVEGELQYKNTESSDWDTLSGNTDILEGYINAKVGSEQGVHGLRYWEGKKEIYDTASGEWLDASVYTGSGSGAIPPNNITNLNIYSGNGSLLVTWTDPKDSPEHDVFWDKTVVVYKAESYPLSINDGIKFCEIRDRNKHVFTPLEITGLTNDTTYYVTLYPCGTNGGVNTSSDGRGRGTPKAYKVMTVKIDMTNPDQDLSCTYHDDAVGMTPGSDEWDEFFGHYPCMLKDGVEGEKLQRNNFGLHEDGTTADITSGAEGDVMIKFPFRGFKMVREGGCVTISFTNNPNPDLAEYPSYAHHRGDRLLDSFYVGAYVGSLVDSKLRSLSGKGEHAINSSAAKHVFRPLAQANGSGYEQLCFYQLVYLQAMFVLKYKHLNSQLKLSTGSFIGSWGTANGNGNTDGMDYHNSKTTGEKSKIFGIENLWSVGGKSSMIDGFVAKNRVFYTSTDNFNDNGDGYIERGTCPVDNKPNNTMDYRYIKEVYGSNELGFLATNNWGIESTRYFGDVTHLGTDGYMYYSDSPERGYTTNDAYCGIFAYNISRGKGGAGGEYADINSRLTYFN